MDTEFIYNELDFVFPAQKFIFNIPMFQRKACHSYVSLFFG